MIIRKFHFFTLFNYFIFCKKTIKIFKGNINFKLLLMKKYFLLIFQRLFYKYLLKN